RSRPSRRATRTTTWGFTLGSNSSNRARSIAALLAVAAVLLVAPREAGTQTNVRIGIQASGSNKSPLLLASFRAAGGAGGPASDAHCVARSDFELSSLFPIRDVPPLDVKLTPDAGLAGAVRVEGTMESDGAGLKFTGEAFDLGTAESVFRRAYTFDRAATRAT